MSKPRPTLNPHQRAIQKAAQIQLARNNYADYVRYTFPRLIENWHHTVLMQALDDALKWKKEARHTIIVTPPRHGKALGVDTPILTPDRGFVPIKDLRPGDEVFGSDGKPTRVVAVSPIWRDRPVYRVSINRGQDEIIADENHEWVVETCRKAKTQRVRETKTLAGYNRAWKVYRAPKVQMRGATLPVDPYVLGLWLGDGCSYHGTITSGDEDRAFVRQQCEDAGYKTTDRATEMTFGILGVHVPLRDLGLIPAKFIPEIYFHASEEDRLSLVQGLMDSDGHIQPRGQTEFCNTNKELALGMVRLVRSLGVRCSIQEGRATLYGRDCGPKYRVSFYLADCARIPRKRALSRDAAKSTDFFIKVGDRHTADTVCIQVEAEDHLFLAGHSLIPTHNSELVSRRLPTYAMGKYPQLELILASYSEDLASKMGRDVLKILDDPRFREVFPEFEYGEKRTHTEITTAQGGTAKFVGVGGGVTGRGANIVVIDDPFKSREEADSKSVRDRVWSWFQDDIMTRLEYPYCVVLTHTRWHKDDLAGRLMQREPDKWRVVHLPLIADYEDYGEERPEYDPREMGDVLWPEVRMKGRIDSPEDDLPSREELVEEIKEDFETRMASNPYGVNSLDQGRPTAKEGNLIKKDWLGYYGSDPETMGRFCRSMYISIDANFRKDATDGSYAALVVVGLRKDGSFVVLDAEWERYGFVDLKKAAERMSKKWPRASFLVEAKANGDALMDSLKEIGGATVVPFEPGNESKESRAHNLADVAEAGGLFFPSEAPWLEGLIDIVTTFPAGAIDDPVDSLTMAVIKMKKRGNALASLKRIVGHRDDDAQDK